MRTKLYVLSAVIIAAIGLSLFLSPSAHAATICGDADYSGASCPELKPICGDKGIIAGCLPVDYATVANCESPAYLGSYEAPSRCKAIKKCMADRKLSSAACLNEWAKCRDPLMSTEGKMRSNDREGCMNAIATGTPYAPPVPTPPAVTPPATENKTSCNIDGIGWIICPVMRAMARAVDGSYSMVSYFLSVNAIDTSTDSPMYKAWSAMRNFANVAFVMSFLIIIYSQITGTGVSNYGIKKMLPRLILAAVLVNVSYWICAIAVDLSNILGVSLKGLIEGTSNQLFTPGDGAVSTGAGGGWDKLTVGLLGAAAIGAALYVGLSAFGPILIAAAFAIVSVVIILTIRQALIIILIVISPLAFVAFLLPNTQGLFNKWRGIFQALLIMYPVVAVVFGGSALASTIITNTADGNFILQVMGAGVSIIPLFIVPFIIKAGNAAFNRVGINLNDPTKGPVDRMKRGAEDYRKHRQQLRDARALNGGRRIGGSVVRRRARREAVLSQRERSYNNAKAGYISEETLSGNVSATQRALSAASGGRLGGRSRGDQLLDQMSSTGGPGARSAALAQAVSVQAKIRAEEVTAASAVIKHLNLDRNQDALRELSMGRAAGGLDGSDEAVRAAAMKNVVDNHDVAGVNQLLDSVGGMDERTREAFADSLASSSQKPEYVGQSAISAIRQHGNLDATGAPIVAKSSTALVVEALDNNTYSADKIATGDREELEHVLSIAADTSIATNNTHIKANAETARTDPRYSGRIGKNVNAVNDLASL